MYASCGATALRALINRSSVFEKWARLTDGILAQKNKKCARGPYPYLPLIPKPASVAYRGGLPDLRQQTFSGPSNAVKSLRAQHTRTETEYFEINDTPESAHWRMTVRHATSGPPRQDGRLSPAPDR